MFEGFWGNPQVTQALEQMVTQDRLAQTLLFAGPEGVGKATLARRLGARPGPAHVHLPPELDLYPIARYAASISGCRRSLCASCGAWRFIA